MRSAVGPQAKPSQGLFPIYRMGALDRRAIEGSRPWNNKLVKPAPVPEKGARLSNRSQPFRVSNGGAVFSSQDWSRWEDEEKKGNRDPDRIGGPYYWGS